MIGHVAPKSKDESWGDFNLLTNPILMKAVLFGNSGGEKTQENIAIINEKFKGDEFLTAAKALCEKNNFNDKNVSMIIRRIKGEWNTFFTQIELQELIRS